MKFFPFFLLFLACSQHSPPHSKDKQGRPAASYSSTYKVTHTGSILIRGATVLDGRGKKLENTDVLVKNGKIERVEVGIPKDVGQIIVDGSGKWLTPGLIDAHSHLGVYPSPSVEGTEDGNENTSPVTSEVWAEHSVWPQDPQFSRALEGGVTSLLVLPGSANLIGGRGVVLKNIPFARSVEELKFPSAPSSVKMACGENPKRVYGRKGQMPTTRMGNFAVVRKSFIDAMEYSKKREKDAALKRDLKLETLADILEGKALVQNHCYRADEMMHMMELAKEFKFKISAFHHAVEAYKVADVLAAENVCAAVWADWWGFKMEAWDTIKENAAFVDAARGCAVIHSDSPEGIQRLNQEAAKVMAYANKIGFKLTPERIIQWITYNPAKAMGTQALTGSIEKGKMADLVLWNQNPFSVYAKPEKVFVDGMLRFDIEHPELLEKSDFEVSTHGF